MNINWPSAAVAIAVIAGVVALAVLKLVAGEAAVMLIGAAALQAQMKPAVEKRVDE